MHIICMHETLNEINEIKVDRLSQITHFYGLHMCIQRYAHHMYIPSHMHTCTAHMHINRLHWYIHHHHNLYMHHTHASCTQYSEECFACPGIGVTDHFEPLCGMLGVNPGSSVRATSILNCRALTEHF